ncbi:MAG TPA: AAA family ATPase, partial [bacterium]
MPTPSFDDIKTSTEKAVGFIEWLAEVLRGKNWVTKLLLLDVIVFALFNPLFLPTILKLFITEPKLPGKYVLIFWLAIGIIFIIALIVAIRTRPHKAKAPTIDLSIRSAIKGLRPFGFEDAEIFAQLQREQSIRECCESITARDFRFGVLCGESGCGKTSFLQAGLLPRMKDQHQCVYVKFTDLDPLESIRQALIEQTKIPKERTEAADFLSLLESAAAENANPLVLFFDQFEQFFVHHKIKEQREPFIGALAAWYKDKQRLPIKIFVCMRGDFSDRLIELQKAMGYSLGPQDSIRLEKLTPHEAAEIFHVIAETEGITCDADFVKELAKQELAREDGLISPVDIQILAWMIRGQKSEEERAFNRHAFQQLGGIEGLLERFLSRVLDVRETEERRQTAIKILLALTDLERNVRAGVLTLESLQRKLAGSVADNELTETVQWLARSDVRLITP